VNNSSLAREHLLWLLGSLSQLYRQPFDAALVAQSHPPPHSLTTLHEAARALGFKTGDTALADLDWATLPLPAIAFLPPEAIPETFPSPASGRGVRGEGQAAVETAPDADNQAPPDNNHQVSPDQPTLIPILIVKSDAERLLYFRPGSQTPETLTTEEAHSNAQQEYRTGKSAQDLDLPGAKGEACIASVFPGC